MTIINLDNPGQPVAPIQQAEDTPGPSGIIDLNTGGFVRDILQEPVNPDLLELQKLLLQQASKDNTQDLGPRIAELRQKTGEVDSGELAVDKAGLIEVLFGTKREQLRPDVANLPEFGISERANQLTNEGFRIAGGLLSTANPQEQMDIIKEIIPEATFQTLNDGTTIIEVPDNKGGIERSVLNKPGMSQQDFMTGIAQALSFAGPAKLAGFGKKLISKLGIGSGAAAGTEAVRQEAVIAQGSKQGRKPLDVVIAGAGGALGEGIAPARNLRAPNLPTSETARTAVEGLKQATGVEVGLFGPQQSLNPSELVKQALVPQLDAGAARATQELQKQNNKVFEATTELINRISPESEIVKGSERFRTASNLAIDAKKEVRKLATKDFFRDALNEGAKVNTSPARSIITDALEDSVTGSQQSSLRKVLGNITGKKQPASKILIDGKPASPAKRLPATLRQLDNAKDEINAQLQKKADSAPARKTQRILLKVKKELVNQMELASPKYKQGMDEFRRLSPAIERLENSIIGVTANKKDTQIKNIAQTIFDSKEGLTNPQAIANAKKIIDEVDPGAWDDLLRVELNRRVGSVQEIIKDTPDELIGDLPGQLRRAIFGSAPQRDILMRGASAEQRKNLGYLEEVLKRASAGRGRGSSTIPNKEALEELRGSFVAIKNTILKPKEALEAVGSQAIFDRNVAALTEVIFDTSFQRNMTKLRKMDPGSTASQKLLSRMLVQASKQQIQDEEQ